MRSRAVSAHTACLAGMWKDCFPCKVKQIVIVNASALVSRLLGIRLAFAHPNVRARVQLYRTTDALLASESIDPSALPTELGGSLNEEALWCAWCDERLALERQTQRTGRISEALGASAVSGGAGGSGRAYLVARSCRSVGSR